MSCRFDKYLGHFNRWTVEGCSATELFRYLHNHVIGSLYFQKYISYEGIFFFSKWSKIDIDFRNGNKYSEKIIWSLDNCIWTGCRKFSVLGREYLSPEANVLTKCPIISHIIKRDIFQVRFTQRDEEMR